MSDRGDANNNSNKKNTNKIAKSKASELMDSEDNFRSPQSDIEVPKARQRKAGDLDGKNDSTTSLGLDPISVTKENMSTSRRPADSAIMQQRLFGWQPILTPYNVLPVLFILGLVFVPLGVVFLTASMGVQEYVVDYSGCADLPSGGDFVGISGSPYKMKNIGDNACVLEFPVNKAMKAPISVYYRLTNFYQNNRLYAKSRSARQLLGESLTAAELQDCDPLITDADKNIYYPCGLVANSYFSDQFLELKDSQGNIIPISDSQITWPGDEKLYGPSKYDLSQVKVAPPPSWADRKDLDLDAEGRFYRSLPDLSKDGRFQNWMKISGLPTFRKLYGRLQVSELQPGTYSVTVKDNYKVSGYQGTKSFVVSTTNWAGGKNDALGIGFIAVGGLLLALGILFLVMFMAAPRKVGDVSYLSWYSENSGDPFTEEMVGNEIEIEN